MVLEGVMPNLRDGQSPFVMLPMLRLPSKLQHQLLYKLAYFSFLFPPFTFMLRLALWLA